jgi:protease-4
MMQGESGSPPVAVPVPFIGGERAGDLTVVRQVRNLMRNKSAAAIILYVDSGGGDAAAAEAMTAALSELAKDRPLVVYMNSVAASGGYHIATPARWIVAQPGTITGSIGVLGAKLVTGEAYQKFSVNRLTFTRGANADLYDEGHPYTDEQRARALRSIQHVYRQFVNHVARSRNMTFEAVDAVAAGRVWTGVQAQAHGLVDELGDLRAALAKARSLADLPDDAPLVMLTGKMKPLPAQLAESSNPTAIISYLRASLHSVASGLPQMLLPFEWRNLP